MSKSIRVSEAAYLWIGREAELRRQTITAYVDELAGVPVNGGSDGAMDRIRGESGAAVDAGGGVDSHRAPSVQVQASRGHGNARAVSRVRAGVGTKGAAAGVDDADSGSAADPETEAPASGMTQMIREMNAVTLDVLTRPEPKILAGGKSSGAEKKSEAAAAEFVEDLKRKISAVDAWGVLCGRCGHPKRAHLSHGEMGRCTFGVGCSAGCRGFEDPS